MTEGSFSNKILLTDTGKRQQGEKNQGTANTFMQGGFRYGVFTLAGDLLKGFVPVYFYLLHLPRDRAGFCSGSTSRRGYFPAALRITGCEIKNMRYFSNTGMSEAVGNSSQALLPALEELENGDRSGL